MERLNDNLQRQATKRRGYEALYECICVARLAAAATLSLKARTTSVSDDFDTAFNSVTETQEIETELWKGLMSLENKVCDPDYRTTRDNSLRIIFQLLTADDLVFSAGSYAARVENSIKASVRSKIGAEALEKLLAPAARTSNEDFKL